MAEAIVSSAASISIVLEESCFFVSAPKKANYPQSPGRFRQGGGRTKDVDTETDNPRIDINAIILTETSMYDIEKQLLCAR